MVKWFDKSKQRYMLTLSKEDNLELQMIFKVYYEKMTPEEAVVDIVINEEYITVKESIDAWNRILIKDLQNRYATILKINYFFNEIFKNV